MSWLKLDDSMPEHPKVAALSDAAFRHHVGGLAYCARLLTDGFIPDKIAGEITTAKTLAELSSEQLPGRAPLWEKADRGWMVHDYLDYNPSREEVEAQRESRSRAGRKGASKRHGKSQASAMANAKQTPSTSHGTRTRSANDNVDAPDPYPTRSTETVEEGREQHAHAQHGSNGSGGTPPQLPPQLERILDPAIVRELKPGQVDLVTAAWDASTELRKSIAEIEAADNPTAMLVSIAHRIVPTHNPKAATAAATSRRAAALAACRRLNQQYLDAGESPDRAREFLEQDYHHDPAIVTEALGPPVAPSPATATTSEGDIPL
jgi:hypothetical protein